MSDIDPIDPVMSDFDPIIEYFNALNVIKSTLFN